MELPEHKVTNLRQTCTTLLRTGHMDRKQFESFVGKCQHACLGIPGGKALLSPLYRLLYAATTKEQATVYIHKQSPQAMALKDLRTMFLIIGSRPTYCAQLIPGTPAYVGHADACKYGTGGIWLAGTKSLHPLVWRMQWPPPVQARFESGHLTINDLEMAGLLIHYLLLEALVDVAFLQLAAWCDNTSAVAWTTKMSSSKSLIGQQLTRALALRLLTNQSSPLAALSISGIDNPLADLASRSFKATGTAGNYELSDVEFLTKFNADFPLTQNASWIMLRPHTSVSSLVCTLLLGTTVPTGSWLRLKKCVCDIGHIGHTSSMTSIEWSPFSKTSQIATELTSSSVSPVMSVKGTLEEDIKSALAPFRQQFAPSARPLNWTTDPIQLTNTGPTNIIGKP